MLKRILIIDDSVEVRDLVKYCIARSWPAAEIDLYHPNKGEPTASFAWDKYDLLILDYQLGLPNQNGLDWLKNIKCYQGIPPILFMTAFGNEDIAVRAIKLGADDYLNKEVLTPKRFIQSIEEILKERGQSTGGIHGKSAPVMQEKTVVLSPEESERARVLSRQGKEKVDVQKSTIWSKEETTMMGHKTLLFAPETVESMEGTKTSGEQTVHSDKSNPNVPGYKILRKVGEGGMASIFLAERAEDQLQVILKILYIMNDSNRQMLRRFIREYRLIGKLDHPNIARIYERAFAADFAYIAMEYCPSGDLSARLDKALPTETAVKYMRQIADGIGAAHKVGIIHRDMKPGNILFRADDSIAITDFGIAMTLGAQSELTVAGSLVGTLLYISPEQIRGKEVDKYSDLYSLGVIFYKMLTGKYPFIGETVEQILNAHLTARVPRLPKDLASFKPIIDGLLAKDPNERFQNAEEFIVGLEWN